MQSIFRYPGGKSRKSIKEKIFKYLPLFYQEIRFPMVGGGGIFFSTSQNKKRWINDVNPYLMSVYKVLKERPEAFINKCRLVSPLLKEEATKVDKNGKSIYNNRLRKVFDKLVENEDSDPAFRYFFINRTVWGGRVNYDLKSRLYYSNPTGWNIIKGNKLEQAAKCMQNVKITCKDYSELLNDTNKDVFIYLDPPYFKNTQLSKMSQLYRDNFTVEDHEQFAHEVKKSLHKILISYDNDKKGFIKSLYKDWNIFEEEWTYCGTSLNKKAIGKELIITNYQPPTDSIEWFED